MRQRLTLFLISGLFWMVWCAVARILFLIYHFNFSSELSWTDLLTIIALGSRMDAAISADCIILTGLLLTISCLYNARWIGIANHVITGIFLLIASIVVVADLELYKHWGFRMDSTPLMYLGSEGAGSVSPMIVLVLLTLMILLVVPSYYFYWKKIAPRFNHLPDVKMYSAVFMLIATGLLFIPIRSSFSVAPLNTGVVYFHKTNSFANHAGINVTWNFFESVADDDKHLYPDNYRDAAESKQILSEMTHGSGKTKKVINDNKPNILLIVLESFTARIVEPLGGVPGVTPELSQLAHEGILFDQFYASGDRTDKGIVAILSGYPAQPRSSIIKYPSKTQSLPFLSRSLQQQGYNTSFVYGGDIGFANMESYVTTGGFDRITEDDDFPAALDDSKWGVHDHIVFQRLLEECDTAKGPFFKMMLTLSSHEPFDVPLDPPYKNGKSDLDMFLNACYYTDQSLGNFIREAKTKSWWKNTLVIITADHGHRFPDAEELKDKGRFRIPMLWLGGAVPQRDSIVHTMAGQTDIANTVLSQIGANDPAFTFSKDILDRSAHPFAVYIFHNGFGYVSDAGENIFDFDMNDYVHRGAETKWGESYMQMLFTDYNNR